MQARVADILKELDIKPSAFENGDLDVYSPIDGGLMGKVKMDTAETVDAKIAKAQEAFKKWRTVPAPRRGELVRLLGEELRKYKDPLGALVSAECGKIYEEGKGEVQEMIDICDFGVGISRQLYGLTIASERPGHHMREYWQPLGPVGIISAFNFPVAVWAWNSALALACGDPIIWKPSEKTPMTALACQKILERAIEKFGDDAPEGLSSVIIGMRDIGEKMVDDKRVPLISATGSTRMGRQVGPRVAERFGKCILELGGNNAIIILDAADLDLALRAVLFGSLGTAGQRCTSTRRVLAQKGIYPALAKKLTEAFESVVVGDPLDPKTLVGPLIDEEAVSHFEKAVAAACDNGGELLSGGKVIKGEGCFVQPTLIKAHPEMTIVQEETFAPILYLLEADGLKDAISAQNNVRQGLSSAIFTSSMRDAERFLAVD